MKLADLEKKAGITDREAFWLEFASIKPAGKSLDAGVAQLRWLAARRESEKAA